MIKLQDQIDSTQKIYPLQANYKIGRYSPYQGNSFTFSNSQTQMNFEIPRCVWNPSRSVLEFTLSLPPAVVAGLISFIPSDFCSLFQSIQVKTSQGLTLVNLTDIDRYTKASFPYMVELEENSSQTGYMCPSIRGALDSSTLLNDSYFDLQIAGAALAQQLVPMSSITSRQNYNMSVAKLTQVPTGNTAFNKTFTIPMKLLLPDSFFALDRDVYLDPINIQFIFKPLNFIGFQAAANGTTGQTIPSASINNLLMLIYQQADPETINMVKSTPQQIVIPYLFSQSTSFNSGGTQTTNFKIIAPSSNPENRVLKIYYLITLPDNQGPNAAVQATILCNSSNVNTLVATTDTFSNPKLFSSAQNYIKGDLNLNLLNFWDIAAHSLSCHVHGFKGDLDYMINSCIPTVFTTKKCKRKYDGDTMEGMPLDGNYFDVSHNIQTSSAFQNLTPSVSLLHHMFSVTLVKCLIQNGVFQYL